MMIKKSTDRKCLLCEGVVRGRTDKKFCDDYCRAAYNYGQKAPMHNFIRNINNALGRNRKILQDFLQGKETTKKVSRDKLLMAGFQFKYLTHTYVSQKKNLYYFCYEFGYLPLVDDNYLIVKRKAQQ